jgi:hypothetical protein
VIYAVIAGALALIGARLLRNDPSPPGAAQRPDAGPGAGAKRTREDPPEPGRPAAPGPSGSPAVSGY